MESIEDGLKGIRDYQSADQKVAVGPQHQWVLGQCAAGEEPQDRGSNQLAHSEIVGNELFALVDRAETRDRSARNGHRAPHIDDVGKSHGLEAGGGDRPGCVLGT